ncbi:MAG TPA: hypothetical protein VMR06_12505 [Dokdonella sp.]|uniref:hypothetical protein n=1 Tax=Dokdonella sp. TaxID=2291710 RepID=UPI002B68211C|nr:hypothetical protein [Dokdonella sp.]HUD42803.1 hypothetical protein [Dokdonella sp.]
MASVSIILMTPGMLESQSRLRQDAFGPVIAYVEDVHDRFHRLPSDVEFDTWKATGGRENQALFLYTGGVLDPDECPFGVVPDDSYAIVAWRGEYYDCYADWIARYSFDDTRYKALIALQTCLLAALLSSILASYAARQVYRTTTSVLCPPRH